MTPLAVASLAADAAAAAIRPYFRSARLGTERKDDESPVTIADREAERAIRAVIERHFPDDGILGEEFGLARPHARRRWLLDPIDGTRAFITGRPLFATLIALVEDGVPVLGVMDQPVTGERWTGARGEATRFEGPLGGTVGTRRCDALASAELSATSPAMFERDSAAAFARLADASARVTWGGDAYGYGLLALGQIDIVCENDLKPWDWAALVPIVEGAGGRMTSWTGAAFPADGPTDALAVGDPALLGLAVGALGARPGALPLDPGRAPSRLRDGRPSRQRP